MEIYLDLNANRLSKFNKNNSLGAMAITKNINYKKKQKIK